MSDELRDRLGALADEATPELSESARRRVLEAVRREGPHAVQGVIARRRATMVGGGIALAAAAALAFILIDPPGGSSGSIAEAPAPACESWDVVSRSVPADVFDLGARGRIEVDGDASLVAAGPCETSVILAGGRVDVRADDLGGGVLRVEAAPVTVEVRGTRFSVTRDGDEVAVAVTEGHVVVTAPGDRRIDLHDGEQWSLGSELAMLGDGVGDGVGDRERGTETGTGTGTGTETGNSAVAVHGEADEVREAAQVQTSRRIGQSPMLVNGNEAADSASLLAEAEELWRDDDRAGARRLFRQVGMTNGAVAEASWVRLARLELRAGESQNALRALRVRSRRFASGRLGAEALWLEADARGRLGQDEQRGEVIERLRSRYPDSPQARTAARLSGAPAE